MQRATLRPAGGLTVPMPDGTALPASGLAVDLDIYWQRRLAEGDVEHVPPPPAGKKGGAE